MVKKKLENLILYIVRKIPWKATKPFDVIPYSFAQYMDVKQQGSEPEDSVFAGSATLREIAYKIKEGTIKV